MLPVTPVLKIPYVDYAIMNGCAGLLPGDSFFSSRSPKLNEIRSRLKALGISEYELKPSKFEMEKS